MHPTRGGALAEEGPTHPTRTRKQANTLSASFRSGALWEGAQNNAQVSRRGLITVEYYELYMYAVHGTNEAFIIRLL